MAASEHSCTAAAPGCTAATLCERCFGRELAIRRPAARTIGACWAERVCRGEARRQDAWPETDNARAIARRKVGQLTSDPRLVELFAAACMSGAAAWWAKRPAKYRL